MELCEYCLKLFGEFREIIIVSLNLLCLGIQNFLLLQRKFIASIKEALRLDSNWMIDCSAFVLCIEITDVEKQTEETNFLSDI